MAKVIIVNVDMIIDINIKHIITIDFDLIKLCRIHSNIKIILDAERNIT
jgi:hypothetical protein